jgi:hypothetical protein
MSDKLDDVQRNCLRLARRDAGRGGFVDVSKTTWRWVKTVPPDLMEHWPNEDGSGRVRLTERGKAVADYI